MIQCITYGDKLDQFVEEEHLIPYRLHRNSRYRTNCYYWIDYDEKWFKVDEVKYDFSTTIPTLDHVEVTWMDNLRAYLCTDLNIYDFRLERDKYDIRNANIINNENSFAGGEIEYWLFCKKANFIEKKYRGFQKYFDPNGKCRVDSNKFYFVKADLVRGEYKNVRFILDRSNEKFYKPLNRKSVVDESYTIEVKSEDILKEKRKRRKKYERSQGIPEQINKFRG